MIRHRNANDQSIEKSDSRISVSQFSDFNLGQLRTGYDYDLN